MTRHKKYVWGIALCLIALGTTTLAYFYLKKSFLEFELVAKGSNANDGFRPDAYVFFHSPESYRSFFDKTIRARAIKLDMPDAEALDFDVYSYCILFGKPARGMYYSCKSTDFDDKSPSYASCRRYGCRLVVVDYEISASEGVFLYRIPRDPLLRGYDGI